MIRNYIKTAFRNIAKNSIYSVINIGGLVVGLTAFILISLWVKDELSYDRFHTKADRIYRMVQKDYLANNEVFTTSLTPSPLADHLKVNFSEVENAFRMKPGRFLFSYGDKIFNEEGILSDPAILDMLTFTFVRGNSKTALTDLHSIVLTEKVARKYFPDTEALGKVLHVQNMDLTVTGVIADLPDNSHIKFDFILPSQLISELGWDNLENWRANAYTSYILLRENAPVKSFNSKIVKEISKNAENHPKNEIYAQPLSDIRLFSTEIASNARQGDIQYVYIFSSVAIFVLILACINFMNLSTARSLKRAKEIGMRKCIGASRWQLIGQFLGESVIFSLIALIISVAAVTVLLPAFNEVSGKQLDFDLTSFKLCSILGGISLVTGFIAGSYPAMFLSSFKTIKAIKGNFSTGAGAIRIRQVLVVLQFSLSMILITGTAIVYEQLHFIYNKDLGFEKENTVVFWKWGMHNNYESFKNELLNHPEVVDVTISSGDLTAVGSARDNFDWEGKMPGKNVLINQLSVDYNFIKTFKIQMAEGRAFSEDEVSDSLGFILNEEAVRKMGIKDPIGKRFENGVIIGVTKDFHFRSMHQKIEPIVFFINRNAHARIAVKLRQGNISQGITRVETAYKKFIHDKPFEYTLMKDNFEQQYLTESRLGKIFNYLAFIAIIVSCLGLFGLVVFSSEQRIKEIGIRKVFGASIASIVNLLSADFVKLVLIAIVIAAPTAWWTMNRWLEDFAYKVVIEWWMFALSGLTALSIALLTVSFQSIRAALMNPVKSLRSE